MRKNRKKKEEIKAMYKEEHLRKLKHIDLKKLTPNENNEIYDSIKNQYFQFYNSLGAEEDIVDFFSWRVIDLDCHIVFLNKKIFTGRDTLHFYSQAEKNGKLKIYDLREEPFNYATSRLEAKGLLDYIIKENLIDIDSEEVMENGLRFTLDANMMGKALFEDEYERNFQRMTKKSISRLNFDNKSIYKDMYDFQDMIDIINDPQFSLELAECLDVYEKEKFFACAAGLGSVLEHLLYLAINKHVTDPDKNKINENSTANDYIGQLKKEPFFIDVRDARHLKLTFQYRNTVSHFNKGIFSKKMCDNLLDGIKMSFDKYYQFESEV